MHEPELLAWNQTWQNHEIGSSRFWKTLQHSISKLSPWWFLIFISKRFEALKSIWHPNQIYDLSKKEKVISLILFSFRRNNLKTTLEKIRLNDLYLLKLKNFVTNQIKQEKKSFAKKWEWIDSTTFFFCIFDAKFSNGIHFLRWKRNFMIQLDTYKY